MCLLQPANAMFAETTRIHELRFLFESVSGSYATFNKNTFLIRPILFNFLNWEELNELVWLLI